MQFNYSTQHLDNWRWDIYDCDSAFSSPPRDIETPDTMEELMGISELAMKAIRGNPRHWAN